VSDEELGRRAVACKHWRWMPGMLLLSADDDPIRIDGTQDGHPYREEDFGTYFPRKPHVPDLTDPATLGCLLHLVREAYADPLIFVVYDSGYWFAENQRGLMTQKNTEGEALVAALEAAP
jgi:hypothetical protein